MMEMKRFRGFFIDFNIVLYRGEIVKLEIMFGLVFLVVVVKDESSGFYKGWWFFFVMLVGW